MTDAADMSPALQPSTSTWVLAPASVLAGPLHKPAQLERLVRARRAVLQLASHTPCSCWPLRMQAIVCLEAPRCGHCLGSQMCCACVRSCSVQHKMLCACFQTAKHVPAAGSFHTRQVQPCRRSFPACWCLCPCCLTWQHRTIQLEVPVEWHQPLCFVQKSLPVREAIQGVTRKPATA